MTNPKDLIKLHVGNTLAKFSTRGYRKMRRKKRPATVENPLASRYWILPPVVGEMQKEAILDCVTSFCGWQDLPFRKNTRFMHCRFNLDDIKKV